VRPRGRSANIAGRESQALNRPWELAKADLQCLPAGAVLDFGGVCGG